MNCFNREPFKIFLKRVSLRGTHLKTDRTILVGITLTLLSMLSEDVVGSLVFLPVQMNPSHWECPQSSFDGNVEKGDSPGKLVRIQRSF